MQYNALLKEKLVVFCKKNNRILLKWTRINEGGILAGIQADPVLKYIQSINTFQHVFISKRHFAISVFLIIFRKISMLLFPIDLAERF